MEPNRFEVTVVGGGIVGLATAYSILRLAPGTRLALLEKEPRLAQHQTGHNSGVIHSGLYYKPGSLKARLCRQGAQKLIAFCQEEGIPYRICGKVVVAASQEELPRLGALFEQASLHPIPGLALIDRARLKELEPAVEGIRALHVPSAGVVDFGQVAEALARKIRQGGGEIFLSRRLFSIQARPDGFLLKTSQGEVESSRLVNCAGLHSDTLARMAGHPADPLAIVPFRGEYYALRSDRASLVNALIYPVPDPRMPFLGVHLTRGIDGRVEAGPNAVLALKREGYRRWDVSLPEMLEMLRFPGFWKMSARFWRVGLEEAYRSFSETAFLKSVQHLVPDVRKGDLVYAKAGVRAQAVSLEGNLVMDFALIREERAIHVINAPSPAATASLSLGEYLAAAAYSGFGLKR
ncbi:MAG: L-2-hydroxyglutarate oxidase [Candidatus Omnitrophica bacterium]|nr:L-2-hydroxyglutarate oxidase [Candidatus Omnitrophota bacterium]